MQKTNNLVHLAIRSIGTSDEDSHLNEIKSSLSFMYDISSFVPFREEKICCGSYHFATKATIEAFCILHDSDSTGVVTVTTVTSISGT